MSELRQSFPAHLIAGKSRLAADDVLFLRNYTFPLGLRTSDDVLVLMALQNSCPEKCDEWDAFFIEALTDFIVHYSYPQGSLDEINVAWLVRLLSTDGVVNSPLELRLILNVIEASSNVPPELGAFALDQLRVAIEEGVGAYALTRPITRPGITRHDLDYICRILRSKRDAGRLALSPLKIAVLERTAAATKSNFNHPGWDDLLDAIIIRSEDRPTVSRWLRVPDAMLTIQGAI
jgi:hypothetical protein